MNELLVEVALPLPVPQPYTYSVPDYLRGRALPGARVVVPVKQREMVGIILAEKAARPEARLREIVAIPDILPALEAPLLGLAAWISRYYGAPPGLTLKAMLPAALWGESRIQVSLLPGGNVPVGGTAQLLLDWLQRRGGSGLLRSASRALQRDLWRVADRLQRIGALSVDLLPARTDAALITSKVVGVTGDPLSLLERERRFGRSPAQQRIYQLLESQGPTERSQLLKAAGVTPGVLERLKAAGLVVEAEVASSRDPFQEIAGVPPPPELTADQRRALRRLDQLQPGDSALLFGVTGSGKTLVYLEYVKKVLSVGRGAIILVPEIALTPQTVARFRGAFGDQVAVLHSGLSDGERADAWRSLRSGERRVAVGARSAIFAPVSNPGVIVLDEEHEGSYKNGETPRYHAREVALWRAREEGALVLLGSATPSAESWVRSGHSQELIELRGRVAGRALPEVELIDLRHSRQVDSVAQVPWSERLDQEVTAALARDEQVLLLLNRRGWSSTLQCRGCGVVRNCPNCSISLTLHDSPRELRCHYCDHRESVPPLCPVCGEKLLRSSGAGTQQLERLIHERFPLAVTARMDLDTTGGKWSHHRILERVGKREVNVLLGTQMIAKGIDFPGVTLVGVVDADTALHLPDFRAAERTFQLIAQVAGRAGRGPQGGKVLVQTRDPEHYAIKAAASHDARQFLGAELEARRFPVYPPWTSLIQIVVSGKVTADVAAAADSLAQWTRRLMDQSDSNVTVLGPAPCPIERIRERWRYHLILKGEERELGRWIRTAAPRLQGERAGVRIVIDRDPGSLL